MKLFPSFDFPARTSIDSQPFSASGGCASGANHLTIIEAVMKHVAALVLAGLFLAGSNSFGQNSSNSYGPGHERYLRVDQVPRVFLLDQNYPNPFNPSTTIRFDVPEISKVTLTVYNLLGQKVAFLVDNELIEAGKVAVEFRASNVASDVYFYKLEARSIVDGRIVFRDVKKMILAR